MTLHCVPPCVHIVYHQLRSTSKDTDFRAQISQSSHSFLDVKLLWWLIPDDNPHWAFFNYFSM